MHFVPAKLRRIRESAALTQDELAKKARLAYSTVNKIENGKEKPRPRTIRALATALKVKPVDLMDEEPV